MITLVISEVKTRKSSSKKNYLKNRLLSGFYGKSNANCYNVGFQISEYRSGTVNSNTVNLKFHFIQSYCEIFFTRLPKISCLIKCTVNLKFHLIRSKTLLTNDFELTVPNLIFYSLPQLIIFVKTVAVAPLNRKLP